MLLSQLPHDILPLFLDCQPEIIIDNIEPVIEKGQKLLIFFTIKYYYLKIKHEFCFQLCDITQFDQKIGSDLDKFILSVKNKTIWDIKFLKSMRPTSYDSEFFLFDGQSIILKGIYFSPMFFPIIFKFIENLKILLKRQKLIPEIDKIYHEYENHIYACNISKKFYPFDYPNYDLIPLDNLKYYFNKINGNNLPISSNINYLDKGICYPLLQNKSNILCYNYHPKWDVNIIFKQKYMVKIIKLKLNYQ